MKIKAILAAGVLACCGLQAANAETLKVYHIGNSLTNSTVTQTDSLQSYAAQRGISIDYGFHIRCGAGLGYIAANPDDVCIGPSSYGNYTPALTNNALG